MLERTRKDMPKTRPLSEDFREALKNNLQLICERKGNKKALSELCSCSESLITKWCDFTKDTLPNFEDLYKIANFANVSLEWFLCDHKKFDFLNKIKTYSDAFTMLLPLVQKQIVPVESIEDTILAYLLGRYNQFFFSEISEEEIAGWTYDIIMKYNIPYNRYSTDKELCSLIIQTGSGIKSINDDDTYRNLAMALNKEEFIEEYETGIRNQAFAEKDMAFVDNENDIVLPEDKTEDINE